MKNPKKIDNEKSLATHAEEWWAEQGQPHPETTDEMAVVYERWVLFAFHNLDGKGEDLTPEQVKALIALPADQVKTLSETAGLAQDIRAAVVQALS